MVSKKIIKNMEYYVKPRLYLVDRNLWILSDEIQEQTISKVANIVDSCVKVMNGEYECLNWDWHVSGLAMYKEKTILTYNSSFECEFSTPELHKMLFEYLSELIRWNKKYQKEPNNYWFEGKWKFED
jgi:hypothetical protein